MKKSIITSVYFLLFSAGIFAQPTQENVINTFKKNGVTSVKITSTVKEWDSKETKYYWKVSLIKTQPVPPADVDGLTGVTLETHVIADYDINSQTPYWSGVNYSEYKEINLPTPTNDEITSMVQKAAASDPNKFFRSSSGKISLDKVWTDDAQCEWINPKKLTCKGMMIFKHDVSYTELAEIQAEIGITFIRNSIKGEWSIDNIYQYVETQKELKRIKKTDAGSDAMSMADRATENNNIADAQKYNTPTPPKYTSAEALANDFIAMLHNLSKEQMDYYIIQMFSPEFRCTGCTFTPNANGYNRDVLILEKAYDGALKFKDVYCVNPTVTIENNVAYFKDKKGAATSSITMDNIGGFYYLNSADIRIGSDASIKNITCNNTASNTEKSEVSGSAENVWKKGDKVMVEENGTWYPSVILDTKPGDQYFIHYDGYASSYDLWVGKERVKNR